MNDNMRYRVHKALRDGNLFSKAVCLFLIKTGFSNYKLQALETRNKCFGYLKKEYGSYLNNVCDKYSNNELSRSRGEENIWICWLQGEDAAPDLVKRCIESVRKNMTEKRVNIITKDNMLDYVSFPKWIIEKWNRGIITNTHLSDLLRLELLIKYGGLWLDATVFLTGPIPEIFYHKKLFMYRHAIPDDITITVNNWLIQSKDYNPLLMCTRDMLYEFWRRESKVRDYFLVHMFLTLILEKRPEYIKDMYCIYDQTGETLSACIFEQYSEVYWKYLCSSTPIHKLSNKYKVPDYHENTYYDRIVTGELYS